MDWSFALDIVVAGLLAVTIGFAAVLNRRLGKLRGDREELERMADRFRQATTQAEESVGRMRISADSLQQTIDKAQSLSDDLAFLIERGTVAADRIETGIRATRQHHKAPAVPPLSAAAPRRPKQTGVAEAPRSEAERELINALMAGR